MEESKLRVNNENINCLFTNLSIMGFDAIYNQFLQCLNFNFDAIEIEGAYYDLNEKEQSQLIQKTITSIIYLYTINNLKIQVLPSNFHNSFIYDQIIWLLDKKYGKDSIVSLTLGASIMRYDFNKYCDMVKGRRLCYDR